MSDFWDNLPVAVLSSSVSPAEWLEEDERERQERAAEVRRRYPFLCELPIFSGVGEA